MSIALDSAFPVSSTFDSESSVDDLFLDIGFSRKSVLLLQQLDSLLRSCCHSSLKTFLRPFLIYPLSCLCLDSNRKRPAVTASSLASHFDRLQLAAIASQSSRSLVLRLTTLLFHACRIPNIKRYLGFQRSTDLTSADIGHSRNF